MNRLEQLQRTYRLASNPKAAHSSILRAVNSAFAGLSAAEKKALCGEFGIVSRPKSGKHAVKLVTQRIVDRWESAVRCQF